MKNMGLGENLESLAFDASESLVTPLLQDCRGSATFPICLTRLHQYYHPHSIRILWPETQPSGEFRELCVSSFDPRHTGVRYFFASRET